MFALKGQCPFLYSIKSINSSYRRKTLSEVSGKITNEKRISWQMAHLEMEMWDQDYIDMEVPGYILFEENNSGEFQFGTVEGSLDYRIEPYGDSQRLEFSWSGSAEMDPVSGRGWAMSKDGQLHGKLYFHQGDDSGFLAERQS